MNIAIFADLHGRLLLAFKLCARWQKETGEKIDLILQAGDLGAFPVINRLDDATRKYAERDPTELGFMQHFLTYDPKVAEVLDELSCPMIFVRGNHEDHIWLDKLEKQSEGPIFPIDAYSRVYNLRTGFPWIFQKAAEQITILGIGRVGAAPESVNRKQPSYIQYEESRRVYELEKLTIDVLLTHHSRRDFVLLERGVKIKASTGMPEIDTILDRDLPSYHFFGHYGGPPQVRTDLNNQTLSVKLADLHWKRGHTMLEEGSMGLLRWQSRTDHSFRVLDDPWLKEYHSSNWNTL